MAYLRSIILVWVLSFPVVITALAQQTSGTLSVKEEVGVTLSRLTQKLEAAKPDTNKASLLIQQSHIYWYEKTNQNNFLDSSLIAALAARELCNKLHFIKGSNEANFMICRASVEKGDLKTARAVVSQVYGEERVRILLTISEHFVLLRELRSQIDTAFPILNNAINLSKSIGSSSWYYQSLLLLGKYYFIKGDFGKGKEAVLRIIRSCDSTSDFAGEAHYWSELGIYMPKTDSTYRDIVHCHTMAIKFYLKAGNKKEAAYSLEDKAMSNLVAGQPDSAEREALEAFSWLHAIKEKPSFDTYLFMSDIYQVKGNFPKALNYAIDALNLAGPLSERKKWKAETELGIIYDELNQPEKALPYLKSASDYSISVNDYEMFFWKYRTIEDQIKTGDTKNALKQFLVFAHKVKPMTSNQQEIIAAAYGDLYYALGDFEKAEGYYLEMIEQDKQALPESKKQLGYDNNIHGSEAFYKIGGFYLARKQYATARPYLLYALTGPNSPGAEEKSNMEFSLFKVDSALGKFESAIRHFEHSKNVKDSMFSAIKSRQISELEIQYETGQREKSFLALQNKSMLQNEELEKGRLEKNITLAGVATLFVIAGLAYNGYRNKKRSNLKLTRQQSEINDKNHKLQHLVEDKDKLLSEKDWLLKEVHHRVKNNLQIVMSLLSTQSAYLESVAALDAIHESQHRVQAIALIHQRLYRGSDVTNIGMHAYVSDLVGYLSDCFDTRRQHIRIEQLIEPIYLDLSQTVPLGLILNEAITNAIKYAFDEQGGAIIISMQLIREDELMLHISDNGRGLPADFDLTKTSSLGMEMMKALSKQLGGELKLVNDPGLHISLVFRIEKVLNPGADTLVDLAG